MLIQVAQLADPTQHVLFTVYYEDGGSEDYDVEGAYPLLSLGRALQDWQRPIERIQMVTE